MRYPYVNEITLSRICSGKNVLSSSDYKKVGNVVDLLKLLYSVTIALQKKATLPRENCLNIGANRKQILKHSTKWANVSSVYVKETEQIHEQQITYHVLSLHAMSLLVSSTP